METNNLRKAAEMALEALECAYRGKDRAGQVIDAIVALEKALAQPDEVLAEREACAVLCENMERNGAWITKEEAAAAIRARGIKNA